MENAENTAIGPDISKIIEAVDKALFDREKRFQIFQTRGTGLTRTAVELGLHLLSLPSRKGDSMGIIVFCKSQEIVDQLSMSFKQKMGSDFSFGFEGRTLSILHGITGNSLTFMSGGAASKRPIGEKGAQIILLFDCEFHALSSGRSDQQALIRLTTKRNLTDIFGKFIYSHQVRLPIPSIIPYEIVTDANWDFGQHDIVLSDKDLHRERLIDVSRKVLSFLDNNDASNFLVLSKNREHKTLLEKAFNGDSSSNRIAYSIENIEKGDRNGIFESFWKKEGSARILIGNSTELEKINSRGVTNLAIICALNENDFYGIITLLRVRNIESNIQLYDFWGNGNFLSSMLASEGASEIIKGTPNEKLDKPDDTRGQNNVANQFRSILDRLKHIGAYTSADYLEIVSGAIAETYLKKTYPEAHGYPESSHLRDASQQISGDILEILQIPWFERPLADAFDRFVIDSVLDSKGELLFATNRLLAEKIAKYAISLALKNNPDSPEIRIVDPFMGSGWFLNAVIRERAYTLAEMAWWDINPRIFRIGQTNVLLHSEKNVDLEIRDAFDTPPKYANLIIGNTPFGINRPKGAAPVNHILWELIEKLKPGGILAVIIWPGEYKEFSRNFERFSRVCNLRCVWSLGKAFAPSTNIEAFAVFIEKTPQYDNIVTYRLNLDGRSISEGDFPEFESLLGVRPWSKEPKALFRMTPEEVLMRNGAFIFNRSAEPSSIIRSPREIMDDVAKSHAIIRDGLILLSKNMFGEIVEHMYEQNKNVPDVIGSVLERRKMDPVKLYEILVALESSNFLVLAGPSGVWKSTLVRDISEALDADFCKFPVKSNFHDESWLLGYWNPLLSKYEGTQVVEFMFSASRNPDIPHFLLLDEMNLSKIENYFWEWIAHIDDLKSRREIRFELFRTLVDSPQKVSGIVSIQQSLGIDPWCFEIRNVTSYGENTIDWGTFASVAGSQQGRMANYFDVRLSASICSNFHIIGTVNEDESANGLSNKVLDRCFYIPIGAEYVFSAEVPELAIPWGASSLLRHLAIDKYGDFHQSSAIRWYGAIFASEGERTFFNELNRILSKIDENCVIGYRAMEEIAHFWKNFQKDGIDSDWQNVKDRLIVFKVLPKIRNSLFLKENMEGILNDLKSHLESHWLDDSKKSVESIILSLPN